MAAQTTAVAQHATLSTTVADSVVFTGVGKYLCVTNHAASGGANLYFRADGTTAVSLADNTYVVLPQQAKVIGPSMFGPATRLSIVGSGNVYSAEIF
jgi:ribosomal protein L14